MILHEMPVVEVQYPGMEKLRRLQEVPKTAEAFESEVRKTVEDWASLHRAHVYRVLLKPHENTLHIAVTTRAQENSDFIIDRLTELDVHIACLGWYTQVISFPGDVNPYELSSILMDAASDSEPPIIEDDETPGAMRFNEFDEIQERLERNQSIRPLYRAS